MESPASPRVFATRALPGQAFGTLPERVRLETWERPEAPTPADLRARAGRAEGLLCLLSDRIDAELLAACPQLRVVSSCSVGLDHVDVAAASRRGIAVGFTPGVLVETTAELAFGLLLAAARRIPEADRYVRTGRWAPGAQWDPELLLGRDLYGATLGVLGLGAIGRAVARRALGCGMRCLGWTRSGRSVPGVESASLGQILERVDFLSVHLALAPETRGLLGREALARLRPGAVLVNTARGGIVDEAALAEGLHSGRIGAAALDVFEREPLDLRSPLLDAPNLVLTPHIGSATRATRARMGDLAVENLLAGLAGRRPRHCANPELFSAAGPGR